MTRGTPELDAFVKHLDKLLKELAQAGQGRVTYRLVEVKTDEGRAAAKEAGVQEVVFEGRGPSSEATVARRVLGIQFRYGPEKDVIPVLAPDQSFGLEFWISNKIREIRAKGDGISLKIGVLKGHGELALDEPNLIVQSGSKGPNIEGIITQSFPFYRFEAVDLHGVDAPISADLTGLLLTQPQADLDERALRRIDEFMMRGGKGLAVFASAVDVAAHDETMTAHLRTHGLEALLRGYGVELQRDVVLDWGRSFSVPMATSGSPTSFRAAAIPLVASEADAAAGAPAGMLDGGFMPFFRLTELAFPFASTLVAHPEKQPLATLRIVARSTARATAETFESRSLGVTAVKGPGQGAQAEHVLAIGIEGKLTSAFGGGAPPVDARVLVVASSQFLANPFARAAPSQDPLLGMAAAPSNGDVAMLAMPYAQKHLTETILAFKNTLDWLSNDAGIAACSATLTPRK